MPADSQTLSSLYCHVEENLCEDTRYHFAFARSETGDAGFETDFQFSRQAACGDVPRRGSLRPRSPR